MAYEKQTFTDGEVLTAAQLNHIEDGLEAFDSQMGDVDAALDAILAIQETLIGGETE